MKRAFVAMIIIGIFIVLGGLGVWYMQDSRKHDPGTLVPVVVGLPSPYESSALVYIAENQGYFAKNGLNVTIKEYDTGLHAVNDMQANKTPDIAVAAEYIIVGKAFEHAKVCGISTISRQENFFIAARKDHGINQVSDLKGKKIGIAPGTISGFYVGRYLELHGISMRDVSIVDTPPAYFTDSICNGTIDAVSVWGTYTDSIEERLGANAIVWPDQSGQLVYWTAICRSDWAAEHPELVTSFLRSLDEASKFAVIHPAESMAIMKERTHDDEAYIASVWSNSQYSLSLDQSLITAMEDEGRWDINNNLTAAKTIPDYTDYLYLDGLGKVKPEAVNIIRSAEAS